MKETIIELWCALGCIVVFSLIGVLLAWRG